MKQTYRGSRHCGRVRFEVDAHLDLVRSCDFSICRRRGALVRRVEPESFRLPTPLDDLALYTFRTHVARDCFCKTCGILPFRRPVRRRTCGPSTSAASKASTSIPFRRVQGSRLPYDKVVYALQGDGDGCSALCPKGREVAMRLGVGSDFVELRITDILPQDSPRPGDVELTSIASVYGFSGSASCSIEEPVFKAFAAAVQRLHARIEGSATLTSMSRGELSLSLAPANPRGYVSVRIAIARIASPECSMTGTFEVELPDLAELVNWAQSPQIGS